MLLFVNFDVVVAVPADAVGPHADGAAGVRRLESVLRCWPQLRVVVSGPRRYRLTLPHFRGFFAPELAPRVIATTPLDHRWHDEERSAGEAEVLQWLHGASAERDDWLAVDVAERLYRFHADRVLRCATFTRDAVRRLHVHLVRRARYREWLARGGVVLAGAVPA